MVVEHCLPLKNGLTYMFCKFSQIHLSLTRTFYYTALTTFCDTVDHLPKIEICHSEKSIITTHIQCLQ